jgi:glycosyltransferase involved in cell wall biosynthesis
MPKVTVVVPNFNHERFLRQRLASVAAQTFNDIEIVLLDDCSTDGSRAVLSDFARTSAVPSRTAFNEANSGSPFNQWRKGAEMATGEFLWIAESDDVADPRLLHAAMEAVARRPSVGLVYCQSRIIDEQGTDLGTNLAYTDPIDTRRWQADYVNDGRDECGRYLCRYNTIPNASAVVVRRDRFLAASRAATGLRLTGDWMIWAGVLLASDVAYVAAPLNSFRVHMATVRKTTSVPRMLDESATVRLFIADALGDDDEVRRRILDETFAEWQRWAPHLGSSATLAWFAGYRRRIARLGPTRAVSRLYAKHRMLHWGSLCGLRTAGHRAAERRQARGAAETTSV